MHIPIPMSEEHAAMSATVRELLDRHVDVRDVRALLAASEDVATREALWGQVSAVGLPGITIPDEYGGMGGSAIDTFVAFRDWGRAVHQSPLFASIAMAAPALVHAGSASAKDEHLPALAGGTLIATLAAFEGTTRWAPTNVRADAVLVDGDDYVITGSKSFVLEVPSSQLVLVVARAEFGLGLFAVDPAANGVSVETLQSLDLTRSVSHLHLDGAQGRLLSERRDCAAQLTDALAVANLALVAEEVGGAEAVLEMAVDYAKVREQFGRPIGSFQAIKHKLAELAVTVEGMVSAGWDAAEKLEAGAPDAEQALLLAKIVCAQGYYQVARANIQVHGGIGFTWEHPAHLYFRRAVSSSMALGDVESDRASLYDLLIAPYAATAGAPAEPRS